MAETTSPASRQRYGVQRVCRAWGVGAPASIPPGSRSRAAPSSARRRGVGRTGHSDEALLAAIRKDLDLSPWTGEGHRKVWARLRVRDGIRCRAGASCA